MQKSKFSWANIYLVCVFIFLYLPIFYLIFYSFNAGETMNSFTGFSLHHFSELFSDTRLVIILLNTFLLAFLSALIATFIGIFGALFIYYLKRRSHRNTLLSLNNILIVSPDVTIGASFLILFST